MSHELLQILVVAVAALVVLETIVLVGAVLLMLKFRKPLEQLVANACTIGEIARRRAEHLDVVLEQIDNIVQNWAAQADSIAQDLLRPSRTEAIAVGRSIGELALKIQHTTWELQRTIEKPFREAHALGAGFRVAVEYLFPRGRLRTNGRDT